MSKNSQSAVSEDKKLLAARRPASQEAAARRSARKQRKFYVLGRDYRQTRGAGIELMNGDDLFCGTPYGDFVPPGPKERGFRDYPVRPRYRVSRSLGRKLNDVEFLGEYWIVSDRAKQVLANVAGADLDFLPVDTVFDESVEETIYWLCDVVPVLDAIDDLRSDVKVVIADNGERVHQIIGRFSLVFDENIVGNHIVFRLFTNNGRIICHDVFKNTVKRSGLTGFSYRDTHKPA